MIKAIKIFTMLILISFSLIECTNKKSSSTLPSAPAENQELSATYSISKDKSTYTVNGATDLIEIPEGVEIYKDYAGAFNVELDKTRKASYEGKFSGKGQIKFTVKSCMGCIVEVTLTGDENLNPAFSATFEIAPFASKYVIHGKATVIDTKDAIIATKFDGSLNINLDDNGNGNYEGIFKGTGQINFSINSGIKDGKVTVILKGNGELPKADITYSINGIKIDYTYKGTSSYVNLPEEIKIATPVNNKHIHVDIDQDGNGNYTGSFSGTGSFSFEIPSGYKDGKISFTFDGNGDIGYGSVSGKFTDNSTVILIQPDGQQRSATTTKDNPIYIFENVPTGEATVKFVTTGGTVTMAIQVNQGENTQVNPFGSTQELLNSLRVQVFDMNGSKNSVNNIDEKFPLGEPFYTREINITPRSFEDGFPGVTNRFEWFGIIYKGVIKAPASGVYTFHLLSDDGSVLYINGNTVVDNDGFHAAKTKSGNITLSAGQKYDLVLKYFQGPRTHIAMVFSVTMPDGTKKLFNMNDFK